MADNVAKKKVVLENKQLVTEMAYRSGFLPAAMKKMTLVAVINSGVSVALIIGMTAMYAFRPEPQSFAVTPDGRIVELKPLDKEISNSAVTGFISRAVIESYTLDFLNWKNQIGALSPLYTQHGYDSFLAAITPLRDKVVEGRFITSVGLVNPPVIVKQAVIGGVMKYRINMDILLGMESQTKRVDSIKWHIDVIADRVPFSVNPVGIAIDSIVATQENALSTQ